MIQRKQIAKGADATVDHVAARHKSRASKRSFALMQRILDQHPEVKAHYEEELTKLRPTALVNRKEDVPYNPELADYICERVASGSSLRRACVGDDMPEPSTFNKWCNNNQALATQYALACMAKAQVWADELVDISDDSTNDYMEIEDDKGHTKRVFDGENMRRTALRVDTRKWYLSKIMPKQFGDAQMLKLADAEGRVLPSVAPTLNIIGVSNHRGDLPDTEEE